jgi:hypothetical protein
MPIEWNNNKIAVRTWELVPRFFSSSKVLVNRIIKDKDKPHGIRKLQSGGNGRELLIDFDSLGKAIRDELGDPRRVECWMDKFFKMDDEATAFYRFFRFEGGSKLGEEHVHEYSVNASTLRAAKMLRQARERERMIRGGSVRGVSTTIWQDTMSFRCVQKMKYGFEHSLPNNERRFLEALRKFEELGYESLISKKHNNKNAVKVTADVVELLNNMFAGRIIKPTATEIYREYTRFLVREIEVISDYPVGEVINPDGYPELSQTTVMAYLQRWENRIGTHAKRSGDRQRYMNDYKVTHRFKTAEMSGSILSVDDRNPPFVLPDGKRVWFYIGIDLASEAWTTFVHGRSKEGIIKDFYQNLVRDYASYGVGLPLELECESSLNAGLKESILRDGVLFKKVRIEKNNSTGKKIEQYFGRIRYGLEKKIAGWQGRPFARREANQARTEKPLKKDYSVIVKDTIEAMQEWNSQPHPVYTDKTRWEVFLGNQNPKCKAINWEMVLPAIGKEAKTSCRVGYVELNGQEWCLGDDGQLATGDKLIQIMKVVEGRKLVVKWLDDAEGKVIKAYAYINDRYVCELVEVPMYSKAYFERTEQDFENANLMSAYSNTVYQFGMRQKNAIEKVTIIERKAEPIEEREVESMEWPTEEEIFTTTTTRKKQRLADRW